jgi:hypothetical protein
MFFIIMSLNEERSWSRSLGAAALPLELSGCPSVVDLKFDLSKASMIARYALVDIKLKSTFSLLEESNDITEMNSLELA